MSDNFDKYKGRLHQLHRQAKSVCWTPGLATFVYLSVAVLLVTIVLRVIYTFAGGLGTIAIFVTESALLLGSILYYEKQVREYMREQSIDIDNTEPGFYEAYEDWKERTRKAMPDGGSF
jgi:hypothetical protein